MRRGKSGSQWCFPEMESRQHLTREEDVSLQTAFDDIRRTVVMDHIVGDLIQGNVLTLDDWEKLTQIPDDKARTERFVFQLRRSPSNTYQTFISALYKNGYEELATLLENLKATAENATKNGENTEQQQNPGASASPQEASDSQLLGTSMYTAQDQSPTAVVDGLVQMISREMKQDMYEMHRNTQKEFRALKESHAKELGIMQNTMKKTITQAIKDASRQTASMILDMRSEHEKEAKELQEKIRTMEDDIKRYRGELQRIAVEKDRLLTRCSRRKSEKDLRMILEKKEKELQEMKEELGRLRIERASREPGNVAMYRKPRH